MVNILKLEVIIINAVLFILLSYDIFKHPTPNTNEIIQLLLLIIIFIPPIILALVS